MASPSDYYWEDLLELVEAGLLRREGSIATQCPDRFLMTSEGWEAVRGN